MLRDTMCAIVIVGGGGGGADTFSDSWLLNGLQRGAFKLEKFEEMFPNWHQLHLSYKNNPHTLQKCNMPIPACTVIEKTPVDFEITNCYSVVPFVEDSTHDVKPVVKKNLLRCYCYFV